MVSAGRHFARRVLSLVRERATERHLTGQVWTENTAIAFRSELRRIAEREAYQWRVSEQTADAVLELIDECFTLELSDGATVKLGELEAHLRKVARGW